MGWLTRIVDRVNKKQRRSVAARDVIPMQTLSHEVTTSARARLVVVERVPMPSEIVPAAAGAAVRVAVVERAPMIGDTA